MLEESVAGQAGLQVFPLPNVPTDIGYPGLAQEARKVQRRQARLFRELALSVFPEFVEILV